jgi:hypothetical protein
MDIRRFVVPAFLIALEIACSSPTQPATVPAVLTIVGDQKSDTVESTFSDTLLITVQDSSGQLAKHVAVRLNSAWEFNTHVWLIPTRPPLPAAGFTGIIDDVTDSAGQLKVRVKTNVIAGPARIVVEVPSLALKDTARYTVLPGAATHVFSLPADTAVQVGKTLTIRARVTDRFSNNRPDVLTYDASSTGVTLNGPVVTGAAIGRIKLYARSGDLADSTLVSVVPSATFAASSGFAIYLFESDLTGLRSLSTQQGDWMVWNPNGLELLIANELRHMTAIALDGSSRQILADGPVNSIVLAPQYSANGAFIYYTAVPDTLIGGSQIWRANADGSAPVALPNIPFDGPLFPSPSPDGKTLVFFAYDIFGGPTIHWYDLVAQTTLATQAAGQYPRWSPDGQHIAFNRNDRIMLMNADGSGAHAVTSPGTWQGRIGWSPDGQWLVSGQTLIQLSTGLLLRLPQASGVNLGELSWKP